MLVRKIDHHDHETQFVEMHISRLKSLITAGTASVAVKQYLVGLLQVLQSALSSDTPSILLFAELEQLNRIEYA